MKLLIDTNVVLDVLLNRAPFCSVAAEVLNLSDSGNVREYISASAITDIYYIANRQMKDKAAVKNMIRTLLDVVSVAGVTEAEITKALESEWNDFEDSVQHAVAVVNGFDGVITRNPIDYKQAEIAVWTPEEIVKIIRQEQGQHLK